MRLDKVAEVAGLDLTSETVESLQVFAGLVAKWTMHINLISRATVDTIWSRHIADSAQLLRLVPSSARKFVDLGSGGGFPGMVLAILARQQGPGRHMVLIESDQRKSAFLREAARMTGAPVDVLCARAEQLPSQAGDVVTARALSGLPELLGYVSQHVASAGVAILPKGAAYIDEVDRARLEWAFDVEVFPSQTDAEARILRISNLSRLTGSAKAS